MALVLFANVDPSCAGPAAREGPVVVELDPMACVEDLTAELARMRALRGQTARVDVVWQGARLKPTDTLADVGLCNQSTVQVTLGMTEKMRQSQAKTMLRAVASGNKKQVAMWLDQGVSASTTDPSDNNRSALYRAVSSNDIEIATLLLDRGAYCDARDGTLSTPLHLAARGANHGMIKLLLERGAEVNVGNTRNVTPLMLSAQVGDLQGAQLLVEKGASLILKDDHGNTALQLAGRLGKKLVADFLRSAEKTDLSKGR
eukprot:Hpha_TRINITY_DN16890_c0_g5::TRINITY_DN16890_c0_g5_i1::g.153497::m.153497